MVDANGNLLIVTGFGVTGAAAPVLPALSAEGATVTDGTVTWTVVAATSQGFRVDWLPNATSPNYQIIPYYQVDPPKFATLSQMLDRFSVLFRALSERPVPSRSSGPSASWSAPA